MLAPSCCCVQVVGCVRGDELTSWKMVPEGMRGYQGVYSLEKKIFDAAVRDLTTVKGPNPRDSFSLMDKSSRHDAAIAGARAAATQITRKDQYRHTKFDNNTRNIASHSEFKRDCLERNNFDECSKATSSYSKEHARCVKSEDSHSQCQPDCANMRPHS